MHKNSNVSCVLYVFPFNTFIRIIGLLSYSQNERKYGTYRRIDSKSGKEFPSTTLRFVWSTNRGIYLVLESSPVTVIEVLSDLILHPDNGYDTTLQCLYVWQDLQNNPYTLSSILEEIQNARDADIVCWCLTLINRLIQYSPDTVKRIRIRRELEGKLIVIVLKTICF